LRAATRQMQGAGFASVKTIVSAAARRSSIVEP
jgi:hypothetical protein